MKEKGVVTRRISEKLVEVAFPRSEACAKCRACHDAGEGMVAIEAVDEVGAKRGDEVEIEIPSEEIIRGSVVVFFIPIFFLIAGYLLGSALARSLGFPQWEEAMGVIAAVLALLLSFYVVKWYDKNIQEKEALRARIIKVL